VGRRDLIAVAEVVLSPGWLDRFAADAEPVLRRVADDIEDAARRACPVDTGALVATIECEVDAPALRMRLSAGDTDVDYAAYVELGTTETERHAATPAQPYLRPAVMRRIEL